MLTPLKVFFLGFLEIAGNASSDVSINFWLDAFNVGAADFTVLLLSAAFYAIIILPFAVALWFRKAYLTRRGGRRYRLLTAATTTENNVLQMQRHRINDDIEVQQRAALGSGGGGEADVVAAAVEEDDIAADRPTAADRALHCTPLLKRMFADRANVALLLLVTACDLSINVFGTYAAGHIPVLVQVILKALEPLLCWLLSCLVWRGAYTNASMLLVLPSCAIVVAAGGVVAETWIALQADNGKAHTVFWISMYCIRVASSAAYNVTQGTLMRRNAKAFSGAGDKLLLSSTILATDALLSLIVLVLVGPLIDTISYDGWGSSSSVANAWSNLHAGAGCVFSTSMCSDNLWYALLTNGAWCVVYVVDTFLNEASPALNSLMNMLSSPVTTVFLLVFPSLDLGAKVRRDASSVALQCAGVALMLISVVIFYQYERRRELGKGCTVSSDGLLETPLVGGGEATDTRHSGADCRCGLNADEGVDDERRTVSS